MNDTPAAANTRLPPLDYTEHMLMDSVVLDNQAREMIEAGYSNQLEWKPDSPRTRRNNTAAVQKWWASHQAKLHASCERRRKANDRGADQAYALAALAGAAKDVAEQPKGNRNGLVAFKAWKLGAFVNEGLLERADVERKLYEASVANGHVRDDGERMARRSIKGNLDAAAAKNTVPQIRERDRRPKRVRVNGNEPDFDEQERRVIMRPLSEVETRTPKWVWEYEGKGRIQLGALTVFAGKSGVGKSTAVRWLAARLSRGQLDGQWYGQPVNVAVLMLEEQTDSVIAPSLIAVNADMKRIIEPRIFQGQQLSSLLARADEQRLTQALLDHNIRVLIVDPIMSTFDGRVDINRNNEVREYLAPYVRIAQAINGSVIGLAHLKKGEIRDLLDGVTGSAAFVEVPRCVFVFARQAPDDPAHVFEQIKNSAGERGLRLEYHLPVADVPTDDGNTADLPTFQITGPARVSVSDLFSGTNGDPGEGNVVRDWLERYLQIEQPAPSAQVKRDARAEDISESTLKRAAKRLGVVVRNDPLPDKPHRTTWSLPDA